MYGHELPRTYSPSRHGAGYGDLQQAIIQSRPNLETKGSSPKLNQVIDIDMGRIGLPNSTDDVCKKSDLRSRCNGWTVATNGSVTLYSYQEVPSFLQGNPYVKGGYTAMLSLHMCIKR